MIPSELMRLHRSVKTGLSHMWQACLFLCCFHPFPPIEQVFERLFSAVLMTKHIRTVKPKPCRTQVPVRGWSRERFFAARYKKSLRAKPWGWKIPSIHIEYGKEYLKYACLNITHRNHHVNTNTQIHSATTYNASNRISELNHIKPIWQRPTPRWYTQNQELCLPIIKRQFWWTLESIWYNG